MGKLQPYLDGTTGDRDRARLESHLAGCPACHELARAEQQDQAEQARALAEAAFAVARDFDRLVAEGTVDEQRTLIRAFLRRLDFDPETEAGTGYFWLVPGGGPGGRDFHPEGDSSFHDEAPDLASHRKDAPPESDASSLIMVAGARSAPEQKTWWRILGREVPFRWDFKRGRGYRNGSRPRRPKGWVIIGGGKVAGS